MLATIHLTDGSATDFWKSTAPEPGETPGLISAQKLTAAPFTGKTVGIPDLGRNGFLGFWESDEAISAHLARPESAPLRAGWHVRCVPVRALGRWPGLPNDIERSAEVTWNGPTVGLSIGPVRATKAVGFNRLNTQVERQLLTSPGVLWASGMFCPPNMLCSLSFWETATHLEAFARKGAHAEAMQRSLDPDFDPTLPNGTKYFGTDLAFARFRPYLTAGSLDGDNPIPENLFGELVND